MAAEHERCQTRLSNLQREFSKMEELVQSMLEYKSRIDQLKQENCSIALTYQSKLSGYEHCITELETENVSLRRQIQLLEAAMDPKERSVSGVLLERIRALEAENAALLTQSDTQRQHYDRCLDDVANHVVSALLAQKRLQEDCDKLQGRVLELEQHNRLLMELLQQHVINSPPATAHMPPTLRSLPDQSPKLPTKSRLPRPAKCRREAALALGSSSKTVSSDMSESINSNTSSYSHHSTAGSSSSVNLPSPPDSQLSSSQETASGRTEGIETANGEGVSPPEPPWDNPQLPSPLRFWRNGTEGGMNPPTSAPPMNWSSTSSFGRLCKLQRQGSLSHYTEDINWKLRTDGGKMQLSTDLSGANSNRGDTLKSPEFQHMKACFLESQKLQYLQDWCRKVEADSDRLTLPSCDPSGTLGAYGPKASPKDDSSGLESLLDETKDENFVCKSCCSKGGGQAAANGIHEEDLGCKSSTDKKAQASSSFQPLYNHKFNFLCEKLHELNNCVANYGRILGMEADSGWSSKKLPGIHGAPSVPSDKFSSKSCVNRPSSLNLLPHNKVPTEKDCPSPLGLARLFQRTPCGSIQTSPSQNKSVISSFTCVNDSSLRTVKSGKNFQEEELVVHHSNTVRKKGEIVSEAKISSGGSKHEMESSTNEGATSCDSELDSNESLKEKVNESSGSVESPVNGENGSKDEGYSTMSSDVQGDSKEVSVGSLSTGSLETLNEASIKSSDSFQGRPKTLSLHESSSFVHPLFKSSNSTGLEDLKEVNEDGEVDNRGLVEHEAEPVQGKLDEEETQNTWKKSEKYIYLCSPQAYKSFSPWSSSDTNVQKEPEELVDDSEKNNMENTFSNSSSSVSSSSSERLENLKEILKSLSNSNTSSKNSSFEVPYYSRLEPRVLQDSEDSDPDVLYLPIHHRGSYTLGYERRRERYSSFEPYSTISKSVTIMRSSSDSKLYVRKRRGYNRYSRTQIGWATHKFPDKSSSALDLRSESSTDQMAVPRLRRSKAKTSLGRRLDKDAMSSNSGSSDSFGPKRRLAHVAYLESESESEGDTDLWDHSRFVTRWLMGDEEDHVLPYDEAELEDWSLNLSQEDLSQSSHESESSDQQRLHSDSSADNLRRPPPFWEAQKGEFPTSTLGSLPSIQENNLELEEDENECLWSLSVVQEQCESTSNAGMQVEWPYRALNEEEEEEDEKSDSMMWTAAVCHSELFSQSSSEVTPTSLEEHGNLLSKPSSSVASGGEDSKRNSKISEGGCSWEGAEDCSSDGGNIEVDFTKDFYKLVSMEGNRSLCASLKSLAVSDNGSLKRNATAQQCTMEDIAPPDREMALASVLSFIAEQQKYCKSREEQDNCAQIMLERCLKKENAATQSDDLQEMQPSYSSSVVLQVSSKPRMDSISESDDCSVKKHQGSLSSTKSNSTSSPDKLPSSPDSVVRSKPIVTQENTSTNAIASKLPKCPYVSSVRTPPRNQSSSPVQTSATPSSPSNNKRKPSNNRSGIPRKQENSSSKSAERSRIPVPRRDSLQSTEAPKKPSEESSNKVKTAKISKTPEVVRRRIPRLPSKRKSLDLSHGNAGKKDVPNGSNVAPELKLPNLRRKSTTKEMIEEFQRLMDGDSGPPTPEETPHKVGARGCITSWIHVEPDADLTDPKTRANLLDVMLGTSSSSCSESDGEEQYKRLHRIHRMRRQRKASRRDDCVVRYIPHPRPSILGRPDFYYRFGEPEQEALKAFQFLYDLPTSPEPSDGDNNPMDTMCSHSEPVMAIFLGCNNSNCSSKDCSPTPVGSREESPLPTEQPTFNCEKEEMRWRTLSRSRSLSDIDTCDGLSISDSCAASYSSSSDDVTES